MRSIGQEIFGFIDGAASEFGLEAIQHDPEFHQLRRASLLKNDNQTDVRACGTHREFAMKILLLTGPSQVGKSHSSTEYCRSHPAVRLDGDGIFDRWFQAIGQAEYIYKKGSFRDWEHLLADERYAARLRDAHHQAAASQNHNQLILEGVMYRHARVRNTLFANHDPHRVYGLVDYRRSAGDFVRQALGKRNYYATEDACRASWNSHAEQFDPPPHPWFSRQVVTHQQFVAAANEFFTD